jgi:succinate dehydrogenase hydrophobic anchor subunit
VALNRSWLYWPSRAEYAIPWTLGPALFMVLGALGFSTAITQQVSSSARGGGTSGLILVLATALNFVLLLAHVRSAYLSWGCALRPTTGTLALLTGAYILLSGGWLGLQGEIRPTTSNIDWELTLHVASVGAQILTAVLMISAFWKIEEPRLADLIRARDVALPVLRGTGAVSASQYTALKSALEALKSDAVAGRLSANQDAILERWKCAAGALHNKVSVRDENDVRGKLATPEMQQHIATLEKTC